MRAPDAHIARMEGVRLPPLHAVPLERLEPELGHDRIAIIRVKDVDILRAGPGALPHHAGDTVRFRLDFIQRGLGTPLPGLVLGMVQDVDQRLPHVAAYHGRARRW